MEADVLKLDKEFRVVRLEEADVRCRTDHFADLKKLVLGHEHMYPDIARWFSEKVMPGVRSSERVGFIGYVGEKPAVSAIVKRGAMAKFCHLHIEKDLQDLNLGNVFFALMAGEVRDLAQHVYFTLPEGVWNAKGDFFRSFNFRSLRVSDAQYRLFEEELECDAPFQDVWNAVAGKLPKLCEVYCSSGESLARDLLFSVQPRYIARIFDGSKRYELRRKFSSKWLGHRVNLYATEPSSQLVGQATVRSIVRNSPDTIWQWLGPELGCSRPEFERYVGGSEEVFAIELDEVTPFRVPVSRKEVGAMLNERLVPPQSYRTVETNKGWGKAVSVAQLLQGAFRAPLRRCLGALLSDGHAVSRGPTLAEIQVRRMLT